MRRFALAALLAAFSAVASADEDRVWEGHLYVGPPTSPASLGHYWSPDGLQHSSPLENFILPKPPAEVVVLGAPPAGTWRPLFDVTADSEDPNAALAIKQKAASWGADAVVFDPSLRRLGSVLGTAIRMANPGREAYTGIFCATYSPYNGAVRDRIGNYSLATIQQADGPAGAAGAHNGDFILSMAVNGRVTLGNCSDLNAALQKAGPGAAVDMTLWQPWRGPHPSMVVNVPFARTAGILATTATAGVAVAEVVAGSPASAAGVLAGDLLTAVNGQPVRTKEQAVAAIRKGPAIQQLSLRRAGQPLLVTLQTTASVDAAFYTLPHIGVLVAAEAADSLAFAGGLAPGDIILSHRDANELLNSPTAAAGEQMQVQRDGQARVIHFRTDSIPAERYRSSAP